MDLKNLYGCTHGPVLACSKCGGVVQKLAAIQPLSAQDALAFPLLAELQKKLWSRKKGIILLNDDDIYIFRENFLRQFLQSSEYFSKERIKLHPGESRKCYDNSIQYVKDHPEFRYIRGWSFQKDRWDGHAWAWHPTEEYIVETTTIRWIYCGVDATKTVR